MPWVAAALTLLAAPSPAHAAQPRTITMSGASPVQALVADLAYFYRRAEPAAPRFSLVGGGSGAGIADAARGIVDGGMSTRVLNADDPPGLAFTPIALSAVCLVTNVANRVPNFTRAELQAMLAGRITDWSQVPGATVRGPLEPVAMDSTTGAYSVFLSVFVDVQTVLAYKPRTLLVVSQVRDYIEAHRASWGYIDLQFAHRLRAVPYEGVPCRRQTIVSGTYPARTTLGIVTRGKPRGALARFLRWVARDATAKRVISTRYVVAGQ
jgi:phosphate transport system substrate-binding protein